LGWARFLRLKKTRSPTGRPSVISEIKFALNYGGGVKIFPAGPVGVALTLRGYTLPGVKFNNPCLHHDANRSDGNQTLNFFEAGLRHCL